MNGVRSPITPVRFGDREALLGSEGPVDRDARIGQVGAVGPS